MPPAIDIHLERGGSISAAGCYQGRHGRFTGVLADQECLRNLLPGYARPLPIQLEERRRRSINKIINLYGMIAFGKIHISRTLSRTMRSIPYQSITSINRDTIPIRTLHAQDI